MMIKMASTREAREEVAPSSEKGGSVPRHVIGPASHKAESKRLDQFVSSLSRTMSQVRVQVGGN